MKERRKLKKLKNLLDSFRITVEDVRTHYQSWTANAKRGSTYNDRQAMDKYYINLFKEAPSR